MVSAPEVRGFGTMAAERAVLVQLSVMRTACVV